MRSAHGIRRLCQVDSEVTVRLADDARDLDDFLDRPGEVVLVRGNKPLTLRYHGRSRTLFYSSVARDLDDALAGEPVNVELIPPMTGLVARVADLTGVEPFAVDFRRSPGRGALSTSEYPDWYESLACFVYGALRRGMAGDLEQDQPTALDSA